MTKFLWIKMAVARIKKAVARRGGVEGRSSPTKTPRQRARVARILRVFRRNAQQALQLYKRCELWFTSSTLGGWWFAALLLAVVGAIGLCIYFKSNDMNALKHVQLYAVIVIGLGSLYIAGTSLWEKRGSAFFVEYQTATDSDDAELIISPMTQEETVGNVANSTMPYVKRIYIRNEKNKHEAIKKILLKLSNNQILVLKEYEEADAPLLIKPYEGKVIKLNAVTVYFKKSEFLKNNENFTKLREGYIIKDKNMLDKGEIIIETARGKSYIKSNKESILFYNKKILLSPARYFFGDGIGIQRLIFGLDVFGYKEIIMREHFVDDNNFYHPLIKHLDFYSQVAIKFNKRSGEFGIQVTLNEKKEAILSYFFLSGEKKYSFPVQQDLQENFEEAYNKHEFLNLKRTVHKEEDIPHLEAIESMLLFGELSNFCHKWAIKKWGMGDASIFKHVRGTLNPFAVSVKVIKTIDKEKKKKRKEFHLLAAL